MSEALRSSLQSALAAFLPSEASAKAGATAPLREAALGFFRTLGYSSQRTIELPNSSPKAFLDRFTKTPDAASFDETKALFSHWSRADLLFQLTDQELSREVSLFPDTGVAASQLRSYIFFAIELTGADYPRGALAGLARQLNRLFPTPVMVLIKHRDLITLAVINRRPNKLDQSKDVLGRVTLIRDIVLTAPHRGHLDILVSLALPALVHPQKKPITDFDTLHAAWEQIFNVELLNERFYRELANWYFWALPQVEFPADLEADDEKRRATGLIRLLTRLIFCWFLKEKNLIPEKLFHPTDLAQLLKGFDPESETSSTYYQAILQNLFFATLNQRMGKDGNGKPYRLFATDEGFAKNRATYDVNNLYRYEALFRDEPDAALTHFADIPFLNGGLFECLDRTEDGTDKKRYLDGFSRNVKKRPHVPDRLFFDSGETADLSTAYGDTKRKAEKVTGLITILNRYKFTIVENTPIDQEIALDPELLGKVFENLLASYNEETKTTARKQTGSFYTPRPIVDYMVDESLKAHLTRALVEKARMKEPDARAGLDLLFAYTEKEHAFTPAEVATLIAAIDALKILDPACGSGAFPMGVLHKLVTILGKLDPDNERWKQTQLAKLDSAPMREELERTFAENNDDYGRKLYLIENCLYGVDIQPIAIQITKLRFFISLVCDQKTNRDKAKNHGIRPLPNLETKFVAANSLIGLPEMDQTLLVDPRVNQIEAEIERLYHSHFSIQRRDQKLAVQRKIKLLRKELGDVLAASLMSPAKAKHIAEWDPFDQASADFFDPHWMFGRTLADGVDIVIGNPPYIGQKGHKEIFRNILPTSLGKRFHQGKMDLFYFFFHLALDILKNGGHCAYITTNYFITATYADKLRFDLKNRSAILKLTNFNELKIFESAAGQHNAVTFLRKGVSANQVAETTFTSKTGSADETILRAIISGEDADTQYRRVNQSELYEGNQYYIRMVGSEASETDPVMGILGKVAKCGTPLGEIVQANQGIVTGCDKVSPKHLATYEVNAQKGDGIFVLTKAELKNLPLKSNELRYIRPWFKNSDVSRFYCAQDTDTSIIYRSSKHGDEAIPNIKKHLTQFKEILINRENRSGHISLAQYDAIVKGQQPAGHIKLSPGMMKGDFFNLTWARKEEIFEGPKIVVPQRSHKNTFGYNNIPWYASADVYFITNPAPTVSLKFILALLNSKLYFAWLYYKGKRKGEMMELYQKPLSEIPIKLIPLQEQKPFVALVDKILDAKQRNVESDTSALEAEIDKLVYGLYGLTSAEIKHVENALPKSRNQSADESDDDE